MTQSLDREVERRFSQVADRLTSLTGYSELLLTGAYGPLNRKQQETLENIVRQAKEVCELIRGKAPQNPGGSTG